MLSAKPLRGGGSSFESIGPKLSASLLESGPAKGTLTVDGSILDRCTKWIPDVAPNKLMLYVDTIAFVGGPTLLVAVLIYHWSY